MGEIIEIKHAKEGRYLMIDGEPCKVVSIQTSAPGKHGHLKVRLVGVGVFDNKKREMLAPGHAAVEVPLIEKKVAQVISFMGDHVQIMDMETFETSDIPVPEDMKGTFVEGDQVNYWEIAGRRMIVSRK
ncbi:MAG: translation initiation factor IF-5A [Candidatus Aenigmarchaeota archaeon]|nr:translation initiation factor IF-5A [Candidatus Aenigmarchaeota archaeon]